MSSSPDQLSLTADEAVVLFAFVRRFSDTDTLEIVDPAQARALWHLCCLFEKSALAQSDGARPDLLAQARARLRDEG